jgi:branched-chain amino acid transport system substrate-binding protein
MRSSLCVSAARKLRVLAMTLVLTGCGGEGVGEEGAARAGGGRGEVVLGAVWPWASRAQSLYWEGMQLALEEVEREGGVGGRTLRVLRVDDQESVTEGRLVAQRLAANPDVAAVIGHMQSIVTVPAAAIYDLAGMLLLAPAATDPELTDRGYERVFRLTYTDRDAGRQLAEFAERRGYRRIAIYYVRNGYGRALANAFEERGVELGLEIVARQSYEPDARGGARTLEPILREWKSLAPSAILLAAELPQAGTFLAAARAEGLDVPVLAGDALGHPELLELGALVEGAIVASVFHRSDPRPEVRHFVARFGARFDAAPDPAAALGYDAIRLLTHAMREANSVDAGRVAEALRATRGWNGVSGHITFNDRGDPIDKPVVKLIVRQGQFDYVDDAAATAFRSPAPGLISGISRP